MVQEAADATEYLMRNGLEATQSRFNRWGSHVTVRRRRPGKELSLAAGRLLLDVRADLGRSIRRTKPAARNSRMPVTRRHRRSSPSSWQARPGDAVLSEEAKDSHERDDADKLLDHRPADGTSEFSQGRSDRAVQIAVWERGRRAAVSPAAAFSLPAQEAVYVTGALCRQMSYPGRTPAAGGGLAVAPAGELLRARRDEIAARLAADGVTEHGSSSVYVGSAGSQGRRDPGRPRGCVRQRGWLLGWDAAALAVVVDHGMIGCHLGPSSSTSARRGSTTS